MELHLDLDVAETLSGVPTQEQFETWVSLALCRAGFKAEQAELSVAIVEAEQSRQLNFEYRGKDYATNVLSFPADIPEYVESPLLGDLVICASVVKRESCEQTKVEMDHWAHLTIHGVLHLLGFDHLDEQEAEEMESLEIAILSELKIANPYEIKE